MNYSNADAAQVQNDDQVLNDRIDRPLDELIFKEELKNLLKQQDQLKTLIRRNFLPVNHRLRSELWQLLIESNNLPTSISTHLPLSYSSYVNPEDPMMGEPIGRLPTFVDSNLLRFFYLSTSGRNCAERILWALGESHPHITFAPLLYPVVAIFLHYYDQETTYRCVCQLLEQNNRACIDQNYKRILMPTTRLDNVKDILLLIKLCTDTNLISFLLMRDLTRDERRYLAQLEAEATSLHDTNNGNNNNNQALIFDTPFLDWYKWIFLALPFTYCVRIMDCWLVEGQKFLFRIALALLHRYRRLVSTSLDGDSMFEFCSNLDATLGPRGGVEKLIHEACALKGVSVAKIVKTTPTARRRASLIIESSMRRLHNNQTINDDTDRQYKTFMSDMMVAPDGGHLLSLLSSGSKRRHDPLRRHNNLPKDVLDDVVISARIAPRSLTSSIIKDFTILDNLWQYLPERATVKMAKMVFNSNFDGTSLQTFFVRADPYEETIIIIRNSVGEVFGAFCSASWSLRNEHHHNDARCFGNGDTFLFTLKPKFHVYRWVGKEIQIDAHGSISQQLFMSATSHGLVVGSGNGSFGLWLDADLTRGKTDHCKTFNNQPLCADRDFTCSDVELLAFT